MKVSEKLHEQICGWPNVSAHRHRFGGREFCFGDAEIGHVHEGGVVDIPFPRAIRDELLANGLAEQHHWVPNSGWVTFHVRKDEDFEHALWLMELSYLRYLLKTAADPAGLLNRQCEHLRLAPQLKLLFEQFLPVKGSPIPNGRSGKADASAGSH